MKRILVVSKSELYFRILEPYLREKGIDICGICKTPVNILDTYTSCQAELIILDANWNKLPVTGSEILQGLLALDSTLKIITVTNSPDIESLHRMRTLGALGHFYRTTNDIAGIVNCINSVARGEPHFLHPALDSRGMLKDQP